MTETAAQPVTAAEIVDVIRGPHWVSRDKAIKLIETYAAVVASEAAIKATSESFDKCIAITDAILSKPLASPSSAEGRE